MYVVSTIEQDLTVQRDALMASGAEERNIHFDHGLTGTNRAVPAFATLWPLVVRGTPSWC